MTSYSYKLFLLWHLPPKHDCGKELSGDADNDHDHETLIVEYTEEPTAQEPGSTETALKDAVTRGTAVLRHHCSHGSLEDGLLRTHANAPQHHADDSASRSNAGVRPSDKHARHVTAQEGEYSKGSGH